ncbi:hypothetical protein FACS189437_09320 [Bacteroidia bacterium]|nr:hypothetical protein FACS189437_09320 [Bacteroidia bacterium]
MKAKSMKRVAAIAALTAAGSMTLNAADAGAFSIKKVNLDENILNTFESALTNRTVSENQDLLAYYNSQEVKFSERNDLYEISDDWSKSHDAGPGVI